MDAYPNPRSADADGEFEAARALSAVMKFLEILRRRWLTVIGALVFGMVAAYFLISQMRPYYQARTTIVINTTAPQVLDSVRGVNEEELWSPTAYSEFTGTQKEIIKSRRVAKAALDELGLAEDPVFLGIDQVEPEDRAAMIEGIDPIAKMQSLISVGTVPDSRVVWIAVEYPDPVKAAEIADTVREAYLLQVSASREDTGEDAKLKLEGEVESARKELREAEQELDGFKKDNEITSISLSDRQNLITQNITLLTSKGKEAEVDRIRAEARYTEAKRLADDDGLAVAALVPREERVSLDDLLQDRLDAEREFDEASSKYLPKMPEFQRAKKRLDRVEKRISDARGDMIKSLNARRRASRSTEGKIKGALGKENEKALELGRLEPEYRELERNVKNAEESFEQVYNRDIEVGLTNRVESRPPVEELDGAVVPTAPVRPRKGRLMLIAFVASFGLGALLAMVGDMLDQRIRTPADLGRAVAGTGLPVLGQLPFLPADASIGAGNVRAQRRHRDLHTHMFPRSRMAEHCRGVRTALAFATDNAKTSVFLVSSPGSGEGKSSTACNLAQSFCQAGKRVALIDADMRRPRLHHVFPPDPKHMEQGLDYVLRGETSLEEAARGPFDFGPDRLRVITCNAPPDAPAELLDSGACRAMIAELRERFDVIIIDSPPVLRVTDPLILAPQVDGVILVARCRSTTRTEMQETIGRLRRGNTNILGVVLNHTDSKAERGYSYGYGYGYTYGYGQEPYGQDPAEAAAEV